MAIQAQIIVDRCLSLLDAEGSERYTFSEDFIYAIRAANEYVISIFNAAYAENKLSEENLTELTMMRVWQTSTFSRFAFDSTQVGQEVWSILAVHPKIKSIYQNTIYNPGALTLPAATVESVYRSDISFRDSNYSAKRVTSEEWSKRNINSFVAGSPLITCADLITYGYLDPTDYTNGYPLVNSHFEIEVSPDISGELVALRYLKLPVAPTLITDNIEFPASLTNLITNLTMKFIGVKEGELPTYHIANAEVQQLTQLLS